jgi:hypothetical protein
MMGQIEDVTMFTHFTWSLFLHMPTKHTKSIYTCPPYPQYLISDGRRDLTHTPSPLLKYPQPTPIGDPSAWRRRTQCCSTSSLPPQGMGARWCAAFVHPIRDVLVLLQLRMQEVAVALEVQGAERSMSIRK